MAVTPLENLDRDIMIDIGIYSIDRGVGNLYLEIIARYLPVPPYSEV